MPQRASSKGSRLRQVIFIVHLYVGLTLGVLAAVLGLSGSLLVFRPELDALTSPSLLRVEEGQRYASADALAEAVRTAYPSSDFKTISYPRDRTGTVEFWMSKEGWRVYVNPYTAEVLGDRMEKENFFGWLFQLHTHFLGGDAGETVAGFAGVGLFTLSITGLVVWWPRKHQKVRDHLTIKWKSSGKRINYDLHRALGFYACAFLTVISVSGMGLIWDEPFKAAASKVAMDNPAPARPKVKDAGGTKKPLQELVDSVDKAMPGGRLSRIVLPSKPMDPVTIRKQFPHETHPNGLSAAFVDPYTAEVLRADPDLTASRSQKLMNMRYPLHIGRWAGTASRLLQVVLGFTPLTLLVTGVIMWWRRTRKKKGFGGERLNLRRFPSNEP